MEIFDIIAVVWISWVGSAGTIITLLSTSEICRKWSVKKIWALSCTLASVVVISLLLVILL